MTWLTFVTAERKLTHLRQLCRLKTDQVFYLLCPKFGQRTNKVITMEMLGKIRRMHLRDKVSLHEIAKRTGLSLNTVRSWLRAPEEVQIPTYSRTAGFSKPLGPVVRLTVCRETQWQEPGLLRKFDRRERRSGDSASKS